MSRNGSCVLDFIDIAQVIIGYFLFLILYSYLSNIGTIVIKLFHFLGSKLLNHTFEENTNGVFSLCAFSIKPL